MPLLCPAAAEYQGVFKGDDQGRQAKDAEKCQGEEDQLEAVFCVF
jgi:hypothetical protein